MPVSDHGWQVQCHRKFGVGGWRVSLNASETPSANKSPGTRLLLKRTRFAGAETRAGGWHGSGSHLVGHLGTSLSCYRLPVHPRV